MHGMAGLAPYVHMHLKLINLQTIKNAYMPHIDDLDNPEHLPVPSQSTDAAEYVQNCVALAITISLRMLLSSAYCLCLYLTGTRS